MKMFTAKCSFFDGVVQKYHIRTPLAAVPGYGPRNGHKSRKMSYAIPQKRRGVSLNSCSWPPKFKALAPLVGVRLLRAGRHSIRLQRIAAGKILSWNGCKSETSDCEFNQGYRAA